MTVKHIVNVKGIGKPSELNSSFANFALRDDLEIGTLVALAYPEEEEENEGEGSIPLVIAVSNVALLKGTDASPNTPVGVVFNTDVDKVNRRSLTGKLDATTKLKAGSRLDLYKKFVISGFKLDKAEWTTAKVGQPVYLSLVTGDTVKYTVTKPNRGWKIGRIERVEDRTVRFDLLNMVGYGDLAGK